MLVRMPTLHLVLFCFSWSWTMYLEDQCVYNDIEEPLDRALQTTTGFDSKPTTPRC